ncbi:unnamed protein product [Protopolystoma xenopodis]|uniref:C2 domain-containing protein n=1 Tax=Protopolystoma xenopodis TaxID=117903 RepID=A0A448WAZ5_9PLAT|nr:unnamed protein product [Protopolystoma xenopodis]
MNIYDYDSIGLDNAIGRLRVDLKNVDMNHFIGKTMELTGWLEKGEDMDLGTGDLCVVLKQNSADQSLHVTVLEAKRLKLDESRLGGVPDTFVSVKLQYGRRTLNVKHTVVRHSTKTPYFGDVLVFPIKSSKLPLAKVVCKLKYKSKLGIKHVLGRVVIGPEADVAGKKQWQEMLNDPRRAVAMWHTLYPSKYDATDE